MEVSAYKDKKLDVRFDYTVSVRYLDQYERRKNDWRISDRHHICDLSRTSNRGAQDKNSLFEGFIYRDKVTKEAVSYKYLHDLR